MAAAAAISPQSPLSMAGRIVEDVMQHPFLVAGAAICNIRNNSKTTINKRFDLNLHCYMSYMAATAAISPHLPLSMTDF